MLQLSVNHLLNALREAESFCLPEMDKGTEYLYHRVYIPLSQGREVYISSLDFDAFEEADLRTLYRLYDDVFEVNCNRVDNIKNTLWNLAPASKPVLYV